MAVAVTITDVPEDVLSVVVGELLEALGVWRTRTILCEVVDAVVVELLKIAAVGRPFVLLTSTGEVVALAVAVNGVIVTPDLIVTLEVVAVSVAAALVVLRFCGGSGIRPLKLANISATLRRSVWLLVGLLVMSPGLMGEAIELSAVLVDEDAGDRAASVAPALRTANIFPD